MLSDPQTNAKRTCQWLVFFLFAAIAIGLLANGFESGTTFGQDSASIAPADETSLEQPAEETGWMKRIDNRFGEWVVDPLAKTLFYSFGIEEYVGAKIPFVVAWLFVGSLFFTIRMGFINFRAFWHAIRLTRGDYDKPGETGEVSHFQALASALSATIGLGNIAGVAIAIGTGGPGACAWMLLIGLLGMSSKFTECTLAQLYRKVSPDGTVSGGPMRYLKDGLTEIGLRPLGIFLSTVFAILCVGASFGGGCAFQVGQSLDAIRGEIPILNEQPWIYGIIMSVMVGLVIIGGIKSIGRVAGKIVPLMCLAYIVMSLYIIFSNFDLIGDAISKIIAGAMNPGSAKGGVLGVMVIGIQRAVFSNEAGVGSAAIAHSAAKTDEPVSEGIVALLGPFIDTIVVCSMTALVIIITGVYDNPDYAHHIANDSGAALTTAAVSGELGVSWFRWVLYVAVVLFAYSTLISWFYYGERCWTYLLGDRSSNVYKVMFLMFVMLGSIVTTGKILVFSDLLILSMALPNILGAILLSGKVKSALDDYWRRYKAGELDPK